MTLRRNNPSHPLTKNGRRRNGQYEWHNENCEIEDYGINNATPPYRAIWCATHGQWAHEHPIKTVYIFEDGEQSERIHKFD